MKRAYWDTSCVLPLYAPEPLSDVIAHRAEEEREPLTSSALLEYEMIFALNAKESKHELPKGGAQRAINQLQHDIRQGRLLLAPLGQDIRETAARIATAAFRSKPPIALRTLDGIHLATALQLNAEPLLTADRRMAVAAKVLGIRAEFLADQD